MIDDLTYAYLLGSNKLAKVTDNAPVNSTEQLGDFQNSVFSGNDYEYDANGNMRVDHDKHLTITYNYLNLPHSIAVTDKGVITYYYDAAGNKLMKRTADNTAAKASVTTYIGSEVFQTSYPLTGTQGVDTLQFFGTAEGRTRPNAANNAFVYDYFLKDHLGNTRMVLTDDYNVASPILEATSYYPFGLQQKGIGLTASGSLHNFRNTFQKQEINEDLGVDVYEFKYRMDDPQIGRFWQIDPLASDYVYNSTYAFSEDKVTGHVELEGLEAEWFQKALDFTKGLGSGAWDGLKSTGNFVKSLGTTQGWKNLGNGLVDLADRANSMSPTGIMKNVETGQAIGNYISNIPNMSAKEIGHDLGFGLEKVAETVALSKGAGAVSNAIKGAGSTTLFRAASTAEITDATVNGVRNMENGAGYLTGKLFATSPSDAAQFGKINFQLDGIPNTIMKVKVPNSVMKAATTFEADAMKAVSIPAEQLPNVKFVAPLNYTPKPTNPLNWLKGW